MKYVAALSDPQSPAFYAAAAIIESELLLVIQDGIPQAAAVKVTKISIGYVIVVYVYMSKGFTDDGTVGTQLGTVIAHGNFTTLVLDSTFVITTGGKSLFYLQYFFVIFGHPTLVGRRPMFYHR